MNREDAERRVAYWRGYKAALEAMRSVGDFKTVAYIDTVVMPKTEATIMDAEETLAIFDKDKEVE